MAIAPNTTFVANSVLTAAQQNAFGFSTCQYGSATTSATTITTITTTITLSSFTAIASRNYKITYLEPDLFCTSGSGVATMTIKNGATTLQQVLATVNVTNDATATLQYVTQFAAGATTLTASLTYTGTGSLTASRTATKVAFVLVEDIGPA